MLIARSCGVELDFARHIHCHPNNLRELSHTDAASRADVINRPAGGRGAEQRQPIGFGHIVDVVEIAHLLAVGQARGPAVAPLVNEMGQEAVNGLYRPKTLNSRRLTNGTPCSRCSRASASSNFAFAFA